MMTTQYLYGIEPEELDDMKYWEALNFKAVKATELFKELYVEKSDSVRLFWVNKAREHTRKLLDERDSRT